MSRQSRHLPGDRTAVVQGPGGTHSCFHVAQGQESESPGPGDALGHLPWLPTQRVHKHYLTLPSNSPGKGDPLSSLQSWLKINKLQRNQVAPPSA